MINIKLKTSDFEVITNSCNEIIDETIIIELIIDDERRHK